MATEFVRATPDELALVQSITSEAYAPWTKLFGGPPLPVTEDYQPLIARGEVWLVRADGETAGVVVLEPKPDHLLIYSLALRGAFQGKGLGQAMLGFAEQQAHANGLLSLQLYTNDRMLRNIETYRRAGFRETGRRPNPERPGWVLVDMTKPVDPQCPPV